MISDDPLRIELATKLQGLRRMWRTMTPEQREAEKQRCRGSLIAAEISIDDDGDIWFQVINR